MTNDVHTIGEAVRLIRTKSGITQSALAAKLGQPQSFVSKIEAGERSVSVDMLWTLAHALGCEVGTLLNQMTGLNSILDRLEISESEFTELVDDNPSLRGMVMGYAAELKFRRMFLSGRDDIISWKDDDHDREKKGDRRLRYKDHELVVEVKSLQTSTIKFDQDSRKWTGKSQVDGSDRRTVEFSDGTTQNTTLLLRGEFDILAVNCFAFGDTWRFVFALNKDLKPSSHHKYTETQRSELLASMQDVSWPPDPPFTSDWDEILERAYKERQPPPQSDVIDD